MNKQDEIRSSFFDIDAEYIFKEAGLSKEQAPEMFNEVKNILVYKMANLSVTMGMSYERVEFFNKQKESLINDLKGLKEKGTLR